MTFRPRRKNTDQPFEIEMNGRPFAHSEKETHLGIIRTPDNKADSAVEERIHTARRAAYALAGTGLRKRSGSHPKISLKLLSSFIQPSLDFGFETLKISPANIQKIEIFHRKILRIILNLQEETAGCALYILTGTLPMEAHLDSHVLSLFVRILHLDNTKEKELILRQLALKDRNSASWTQKVRDLLLKYNLPSAYDIIVRTPTKEQWKTQVKRATDSYWKEKIQNEAATKSTLSHLNTDSFQPGKIHHIWDTVPSSNHEINKTQVKTRILVGRYTLATAEAKYKGTSPTCRLCHKGQEDLRHFLLSCGALQNNRNGYLSELHKTLVNTLGKTSADFIFNTPEDLIQIILDPSKLTDNRETIRATEPISRNLCYALHRARTTTLLKHNTDIKKTKKDACTPSQGGCTSS